MPLFCKIYLFCLLFAGLYTASSESVEFVYLAHSTVFMLLVLSKHPNDGECHTLLPRSIPIPTFIPRLLSHIFGTIDIRAQKILYIEVENKTGELLRLMQTISDNKGNVQGFCTYCAPKDEYVIATLRVEGVDKYTLKQADITVMIA